MSILTYSQLHCVRVNHTKERSVRNEILFYRGLLCAYVCCVYVCARMCVHRDLYKFYNSREFADVIIHHQNAILDANSVVSSFSNSQIYNRKNKFYPSLLTFPFVVYFFSQFSLLPHDKISIALCRIEVP